MKRSTPIITTTVVVAAVVVGAGAYAVAQDADEGVDGDDLSRAIDAALAEAGGGRVIEFEYDEGFYDVEIRKPDGSLLDVGLNRELSTVFAAPDLPDPVRDPDDAPVSDADRERAAAAAVEAAGGGTAVEVDRDDGGYDVEIRFPDGREVDVELSGDFTVLEVDRDD
jgi:uncharacterized membrane protein YkoI